MAALLDALFDALGAALLEPFTVHSRTFSSSIVCVFYNWVSGPPAPAGSRPAARSPMRLTAYVSGVILVVVAWEVVFHPDFDPEFDALAPDVQDELLAHAKLLEAFGPTLGSPASRHSQGVAPR